ncbi:MAG: hypothetical protein VKL42_12470 [Snowella sp.]|nr:hypothetical protein [Snowella sp.]
MNSKFTAAEHRLWLYLTSIDPFGEKYIDMPDTLTILEACDIGKTTFYAAIAKFQELEMFDFQDKGFSFRNRMANPDTVECPKSRKIFRNLGKEIPKNRKGFRKTGKVSEKPNSNSEKPNSDSEKPNSNSEISESTIYTEFQISLSEYSEGEREEIFQGDHIHIQTQPESLVEDTNVLTDSLADPKGLGEEKFSAAAATITVPIKPVPKPNRPGTPKITDWIPEGPWKTEGKLDVNFRDWLAQCWVNEYGGKLYKRQADVLSHFKKDPNNLPIAWEQYQNEFLKRYQNTQILLDNGVEIEPEYQQTLIANQRAITAELPPEISPIAMPTTPTKPILIEKPEPTTETKAIAPSTPASVEIIPPSNENAAAYKLYKAPVIENPATPEQLAEVAQKLKNLKAKFSFGNSTERMENPKPATVTENQEEAEAKEAAAKKEAYLKELNVWIKDPILRPDAMRKVMQSEDYKCNFNEEGEPYEVVYLEF